MAAGHAKWVRGGLSILLGCLLALLAASALAATPVHGAAYRGALTGSRSAIHVSFRVSASGNAVSAIVVTALPLYCTGAPPPSARIAFSSAKIDAHGTFAALGADKIGVGPLKGTVIAKLKLTGSFAPNRTESGLLETTLAGGSPSRCSGHSPYKTRAS